MFAALRVLRSMAFSRLNAIGFSTCERFTGVELLLIGIKKETWIVYFYSN